MSDATVDEDFKELLSKVGGAAPLGRGAGLTVTAHMPVNYRSDIGNLGKALGDALKRWKIIAGDQWIEELTLSRCLGADHATVWLEWEAQ